MTWQRVADYRALVCGWAAQDAHHPWHGKTQARDHAYVRALLRDNGLNRYDLRRVMRAYDRVYTQEQRKTR